MGSNERLKLLQKLDRIFSARKIFDENIDEVLQGGQGLVRDHRSLWNLMRKWVEDGILLHKDKQLNVDKNDF